MWVPGPGGQCRGMTWNPAPQSSSPPRPAPAGPPWAVVLGLGSMALLWPLAALTGTGGTGTPRALTILGLTAVVWIGVVGLGRVPRPVLTLTLTGLVFGLVAMAASTVLGGIGVPGDGAPAWTVVPALVVHAFWGSVTGLLALAVQRTRAPDRRAGDRR